MKAKYLPGWSKKLADMDIDDWLEACSVQNAEENDRIPESWYAVSSDEFGGIFAYFKDESDACRFRLSYISRKMMP